MEARYYSRIEGLSAKCQLCPHNCIIPDKKKGICKVRYNNSGKLLAQNYGVISSMGFDPIEKKPLYHFFPGREILSIGSLGCNLKCSFCQNWEISQTSVEGFKREYKSFLPGEIVKLAKSKNDNIGIAFTYNEPTVFFEYMIDVAQKSKKEGLKNVMVTNGFINSAPLDELNKYIDAYSVDLKAFSNSFFKKYTKSELQPVKKTLLNMYGAGKHLEITNLVIPGLNDDEEKFEEMLSWIKNSLSENVILHISAYHPSYKLEKETTPVNKLLELKLLAKQYLNYVFVGNVYLPGGNQTYCPVCGENLISRRAYVVKINSVNKEGNCKKCGAHILDNINL